MYPFSSEDQRIVHAQMLQEALARERIRVELNGKRTGGGWIQHILRLSGKFRPYRKRHQSEKKGLKQPSCNAAFFTTAINKSHRTKFG